MSDSVARLREELGTALSSARLIREKDGVQVFQGCYGGRSAFIKRYLREDFLREIDMYRLLNRLGVPTIEVLSAGTRWIVLEDLNESALWRPAVDADLQDESITRALAAWYIALHDAGEGLPELRGMYRETDVITKENVELLLHRLPSGRKTFDQVAAHFEELHSLIDGQETTLTYNDFFWTNMTVRRDGTAAMMFDYNLMGAGWRLSDMNNVTWSLAGPAKHAFEEEYAALYRARHGKRWEPGHQKTLNDLVSMLVTLIFALRRDAFPSWAESSLRAAEQQSFPLPF